MGSLEEDSREFWHLRAQRPDFLWANLTDRNASLLRPLCSPSSRVLDLGAGDGRLSLALVDGVQSVTAVDFTPAVLSIRHPKIQGIQCDIREYRDESVYDLIVIFGVMNFIQDRASVYASARKWLREGGHLVVKHQCGKSGEVRISSDIDGDAYHALYPDWEEERSSLLKCGFDVSVSDPYPPELNPWPNTFFKMFLCR